MKFLHLSDLHLGKSIYGISLVESGDQVVWVNRFLEILSEIMPDAVVIAGDIYDRSNPSGEAMQLFDHMLTRINALGIPVLMIAGNHDSGQRVAFASNMLAKNGIYIAGTPEKEIRHVTIAGREDGDEVTFWLMPYIFPAIVSDKLGDDSIKDYDSAARRLIEAQNIDFTKKNVLVAHQNVTAFGKEAQRGGSETMVGGVGQIDYSAFDGFDYVALGHIHAAYSVGRKEVRYAGSPLPYHFDELRQPKKGPVLVTIGEKIRESDETAGSAAGDVSGNTAGSAAGDVCGNTAGSAAGDVCGNIVGSTAGDVSGNIAGSTAGRESAKSDGSKRAGVYARVETQIIEIAPMHPMRRIEGEYDQIRKLEEINTTRGEYVSICLSDSRVTPEKSDYLRSLFESRDSHVLELISSYQEQNAGSYKGTDEADLAAMSMKDLFAQFYSFRKNGQELSDSEEKALSFAQELTCEEAGKIDKNGSSPDLDKDIDRLLENIRKITEGVV